jgi:hypothetical protein
VEQLRQVVATDVEESKSSLVFNLSLTSLANAAGNLYCSVPGQRPPLPRFMQPVFRLMLKALLRLTETSLTELPSESVLYHGDTGQSDSGMKEQVVFCLLAHRAL